MIFFEGVYSFKRNFSIIEFFNFYSIKWFTHYKLTCWCVKLFPPLHTYHPCAFGSPIRFFDMKTYGTEKIEDIATHDIATRKCFAQFT